VENQVSTASRYVVLGGFTPGTPVSTPLEIKREKKEKRIKRKESKKKEKKRKTIKEI